MNQAESILRRHQAARTAQAPFVALWQETAKYTRPYDDQVHVDEYRTGPSQDRFAELFDGTAISANRIYASGCMSWLTPAESTWFRLSPPNYLSDSDAAKSWLAKCTEIMQSELTNSNFYTEIHCAYLDDGSFGTSALNCEQGDKSLYRFDAWPTGEFTILQDAYKQVDTVFREFDLTPRQAKQRFGESNLPDEVRQLCDSTDKTDTKVRFLHAILPRKDAERDHFRIDGANMPIASIYLHPKSKTIVQESGFWEMPVAVHRHDLWGSTVYGRPPAWEALADARQVNDLQMNMDVLAETAAFPRILSPAELEGEIDLRANGVTHFTDPGNVPRGWLQEGRYDIGKDRVAERQEAVRRAFHVELFQMFAALPPGKEMTAMEVAARQSDKLTLFSPTFGRKMTELINPTLMRAFAIGLRAGAFPPPPPEMQRVLPTGQTMIPDPEITLTSRLALALKALQNQAFFRSLGNLASVFQIAPEQLDHIDFDKAVPDILLNEGVPTDWKRSEQEVTAMRQSRAEKELQEESLKFQEAMVES